MYYIIKDDKITLYHDNRKVIENTIKYSEEYKDAEILETAEGYTIINGELITIEEAEEIAKEREHERIMELKMTPLDFLKAIEQYGITYDMVKQFMEQNPLIERELRFCQNVYRKHPMLNELAEYGITSEILDTIFKKANGEEV